MPCQKGRKDPYAVPPSFVQSVTGYVSPGSDPGLSNLYHKDHQYQITPSL